MVSRYAFWFGILLGLAMILACSTDPQGGSPDDDDTDPGDDDSHDDDASDDDAEQFPCPAAALGAQLGRDTLMIGGSMDDASFGAAPFDIRYAYVAGGVPEQGPCASCATGCIVDGQSCDNNNGCSWWGCWQYDQDPPGRYVADLVQETAAAGGIPMVTYYIWFTVSGYLEGAPEIEALTDGDRVASLLADFRFLCQVMAEDPSLPALLHIEPDLWGYGHQYDEDPGAVPVALGATVDWAAPVCAGLPDSLDGFARCMLRIAREEAPNVLVGFHASSWAAGHHVTANEDPGFDVAGHAVASAAFLSALGATEADFIGVEMSDRDAAYNGRWWDDSNGTLPNFHQALSWVESLGQELELAPLWWQVPYGQMALENSCDRYQDNRVAYVFDHADEFADAGSLGVAFGAGATCMTTPATDDGHFQDRAIQYYQGSRPPLCGE